MSSTRIPNLQPLSMLPMIASVIDDQLAGLQRQLDNLKHAHARPGSMDDATIDHVQRVFGETKVLLQVFDRQIAHWRDSSPSPAQKWEIERLTEQIAKSHQMVNDIVALAEKIRSETVETLLGQDDLELELAALQANRTAGL